jgi:glycosyltransferase involved in cell wall biosynthesis
MNSIIKTPQVMKVSIITVCYQSAKSIEATIQSVMAQNYPHIEHILIDGGSTDGTLNIIKKYEDAISIWISEPDGGVYDAMNKGIAFSTGDIIGFLNADDVFKGNQIILNVVKAFVEEEVDSVFGDVEFVKGGRVSRYYSSRSFHPSKFADGYMPAHPSFYATSAVYKLVGNFRTDFKIASDFDLLLRMLYVHNQSYKYLPICMVQMTPGGISNQSLKSRLTLNKEILQSCREHGIRSSYIRIYLKYFKKIVEYFN